MTDLDRERQQIKAMLSRYRVGPDRFRFTHEGRWPFRLICAATIVLAASIVIEARSLGPVEWFALLLLGVASAIAMGFTAPGERWVEIEQRRSTWLIRWHYGWWHREREVASNRISIATVVEDDRTHDVQLLVAGKPLRLNVAGLRTAVLVAICRLITPGYSVNTYLLETTLPRPLRPRCRRA